MKVNELQKNHLDEIRSLGQPPEIIKLVLASVVILNEALFKDKGGIIMTPVPNQIGKKEENYFQTAKQYLLNDTKLLRIILVEKFDRESI